LEIGAIHGLQFLVWDGELLPDPRADAVGSDEYVPRGPCPVRKVCPDSTIFLLLLVTIEDLITEGDRVVARFTFSGTYQGEFQDMAPTGNQVKATGSTSIAALAARRWNTGLNSTTWVCCNSSVCFPLWGWKYG
jgi:hypothetical protein